MGLADILGLFVRSKNKLRGRNLTSKFGNKHYQKGSGARKLGKHYRNGEKIPMDLANPTPQLTFV